MCRGIGPRGGLRESVGSQDAALPPRAKRVVMITMRGGPSHVDTFDYKPALAKHAGQSVAGDNKSRKLLPSPFKFNAHGESGLMISELYPHVAKHADDLCLLNSMHTDVPNHPQAFLMLHTGEFRFARPSFRRVDAVRTWHREQGPARLCHNQSAIAFRRLAKLRLGVFARDLSRKPTLASPANRLPTPRSPICNRRRSRSASSVGNSI